MTIPELRVGNAAAAMADVPKQPKKQQDRAMTERNCRGGQSDPPQAMEDAKGQATGGQAPRRSSRMQQMGCLAVSSVAPQVKLLAEKACQRLGGMRLFADEGETAKITHLILGLERRTMKVLLAVANGAWLVQPSWLTASMEAGLWADEQSHCAQVRFTRGAERAREEQEVADASGGPLQGHGLYLHSLQGSRQSSNVPALRKLILALGGKVAPKTACTICILSGGAQRPSGLLSEGTTVSLKTSCGSAFTRSDVPREALYYNSSSSIH
ncbi:hypothetical protein WJX84_006438 [Apatococcus fuscideae]|uniref:BRCT domain-containing protein n=1 Tax=Apatococcus fuscideae TaxID=2026836 RepID=A0AAW1T942_9CHLO